MEDRCSLTPQEEKQAVRMQVHFSGALTINRLAEAVVKITLLLERMVAVTTVRKST
jgi:hypothetical protein